MAAYLMLVEGTSWISAIIKRESGSRFSHCAFAFVDRLEAKTYESDFGGSISRQLADYPWPYTLYSVEGLTGNALQEIALRRWCVAKMSTPYDYTDVLGVGLNRALTWLGIPAYLLGWSRLLNNRKALTCIEFVDKGLLALPAPVVLSEPTTTAAPGDLAYDPLLTPLPGGAGPIQTKIAQHLLGSL
jgi:hypothetical protein